MGRGAQRKGAAAGSAGRTPRIKKNRKRFKAAKVAGSDGKFSSNRHSRMQARALNKKRRIKNRAAGAENREAKRNKRTERLEGKAKLFEGTKKGARLAGRAKRRRERDAGVRKSAVGTALTRLGRGALATAALGAGDASGFRKGTWKRAAHQKKKKTSTTKAGSGLNPGIAGAISGQQ